MARTASSLQSSLYCNHLGGDPGDSSHWFYAGPLEKLHGRLGIVMGPARLGLYAEDHAKPEVMH
jgi:hypothetical protein